MSYQDFPEELRSLKQWVGAEQKIPRIPKSEAYASVTDPSTWGTFDDALQGLEDGKYSHLGFVVTSTDPYVLIDLDPLKENNELVPMTDPRAIERELRNQSWVKAFNSLTELSLSGRGYHIICKGKLLAPFKKDGVEVYSESRFFQLTGNFIERKDGKPPIIADVQDTLNQLFNRASQPIALPTQPASPKAPQSDQTVLDRLGQATNAQDIYELWQGKWQGNYPSQSEADLALLSHLCFYTQDDQQVARLFRQSNLGTRPKANNPRDPYVETSIKKLRELAPPPIDFSKFNPVLARLPLPPPKQYPAPPGLLAEIAQYIMEAAIHPVPEVAYAGALAFAAGLTGRHYNVSGTGLNLYILLLAGTGLGKEGAADGIDNLYEAVRPTIPEIETFRGPSNFASGAGLIRSFSDKTIPCLLSVIGEFGLRLTALSNPNANSAELGLRSALLDFFSKSGEGKVISPVAYSDNTKNTTLLQAPSLSILGVSTPETFFSKLTDASVSDGLIPRFLTIAFDGECKISSKSRKIKVPASLISKIAHLAEAVIYMSRNNTYTHIPIQTQAQHHLDAFESHIVTKMNTYKDGAIRNILNRAHLKALRLAGIAAACDNPTTPSITPLHAQWAIEFVEADCAHMLSRFETGYVGEGDNKQMSILRQKIRDLITQVDELKDEKLKKMLKQNVVSRSALAQRILSLSAFSNDKRGANMTLDHALKALIANGEIVKISPQQAIETFQSRAECYLYQGDI